MLTKTKNGLLIKDLTFKYVFSHDYILKDLINSFLEYINYNQKVDFINIKPKEIFPLNEKFKLFIGDIICTLNDSTIINVEMFSDSFTLGKYHKSLGYACRLYSNQMEASNNNYYKMKKVISLVFMHGNFRKFNNDIINSYSFNKLINHNTIDEGQLEMYLVRLDKVNNISYTLNEKRFILWLRILNAKTVEELNKLEGSDKIMFDVKKYVSKMCEESAKTWDEYVEEKTQEAKYDGLELGMEQGMKNGMKKARLEAAKAMLKNNIDLDLIVNCTGLSKMAILKLENN